MWPRMGFFWPGSAYVESLEEFVRVFGLYGYAYCGGALDNHSYAIESGYEKIALYTKGTEFTHVARQNSDGSWTSKLGSDIDIRHDGPNDFPTSGPHACAITYGVASHFFKRRTGFTRRLKERLARALVQARGRPRILYRLAST